jgi:hypothetical protein
MKKKYWFALTALGMTGVLPTMTHAAPLLAPSDFIIAIDADPPVVPVSDYPDNEPPSSAFDNDLGTKYLNFGERNSGVIVTPALSSMIKSMILSTANDAVERDPTSWKIWGTNDVITTPDDTTGPSNENWTLISEGLVTLPAERQTAGPVLSFPTNATSYSSYRIAFPTVNNFQNANSMQIAEIGLFASADGTGDNIAFNPIDARAILLEAIPTFNSNSPAGEPVTNILDGNAMTNPVPPAVPILTKYLNFGEENSGFIVTPTGEASTATSFQITTANDAVARDPASYEIYGTNAAVVSANHSQGTDEAWTLIASGSLALPEARDTVGDVVPFTNSTAYTSYKVLFPTVKDATAANSMQISGFQLFDNAAAQDDADFDGDGDIDGADFLTWQRGLGLIDQTNNDNGDANNDGSVTDADLVIWKGQFGGGSAVAAVGAVPEPGAIVLAATVAAGVIGIGRRRR